MYRPHPSFKPHPSFIPHPPLNQAPILLVVPNLSMEAYNPEAPGMITNPAPGLDLRNQLNKKKQFDFNRLGGPGKYLLQFIMQSILLT